MSVNLINGLISYKNRKHYSNADLAALLGVSDSAVSQYFSGKSGISLDKLSILLRDGMTLEEAFDKETETAVIANYRDGRPRDVNAMEVLLNGMKEIIFTIENSKSP